MAVFIVNALIAPVKDQSLFDAFERIKSEYIKMNQRQKEIEEALNKYPYPKGFRLPKGSDVETIEKLLLKTISTTVLLKISY